MSAIELERAARISVVGHFRVSKDVYDSLEEEAMRQRVSLNTLVNQVLGTHTRDDVLWQEMGFVKLTKTAFRAYLNSIPEGKLDDLGPVMAKETPSSIMLARKGAVNLESLLDFLRFRSRAGWFSMIESSRNGSQVICFMHDFGTKESTILRSYFINLFGLVGIRPKIITSNSSVVVEFDSLEDSFAR
jgi:hypothetical protein